MKESERDLGRRWFELVWNQGKREAIAEMLSPNALIHDAGVESRGADGFYAFFDRMNATFSEVHISIDDSIVEGGSALRALAIHGKSIQGTEWESMLLERASV